MNEALISYVWKYKLYQSIHIRTTDGDPIEIIDGGKQNEDSGPDFFNAKVKIDGNLWVGNVEIHINSSDWYRHHHNTNTAYDTVILHVVVNADREVFRTNGEKIPQLALNFQSHIEDNYHSINTSKTIPCVDRLTTFSPIFFSSLISNLIVERLTYKTADIEDLLQTTKGSWEDVFYIILSRSFGFGVNALPFELVAKSLSLNVLAKHKNSITQLEALWFGQAGLLPPTPQDDYQTRLTDEYQHLRKKYALSPIDASIWKFSKIRPDNFPHIRIAQLAMLIHQSVKLFSKIIAISNTKALYAYFQIEPSAYWQTHYNFAQTSSNKTRKLGKASVNSLIINTIIPFLFLYSQQTGNEEKVEQAVAFLEQLPPEENRIVKRWRAVGISLNNALETQAIIHLQKHYCDTKQCLKCRIGYKLITTRLNL